MVKIKRINVKGKFFVYQFDNKGRIVTRTKWDRKDNSIGKATKRFNQNGSIKEGQKRTKLTNFFEVEERNEFNPKAPERNRPTREYQYFVTVRVGRQTTTARSMKHRIGFSVEEARSEALENALERSTNYADKEPESFKIVREGFVSYAKV